MDALCKAGRAGDFHNQRVSGGEAVRLDPQVGNAHTMLIYDDEKHAYFWNGAPVVSVTQAINEWILVDDMYVNRFDPKKRIAKSAMQQGADRGNAIHRACDIILTSELDWDALDPSMVHPLREFQRCVKEQGLQFASLGFKLYSKKYGYAGTMDPLFMVKKNTHWHPCIIDIKSGGHDLVGPQTAAYEQLYREWAGTKGVVSRACIYLPAEGPHKFIPLTNRNDWRFFQSCLDQRNYFNSGR